MRPRARFNKGKVRRPNSQRARDGRVGNANAVSRLTASTTPTSSQTIPDTLEAPQLSNSVESVADADEITTAPTMMHAQKQPMVPILEPSPFHRSSSTSTESQSPSKDSDFHSEESQPSPKPPTKTITTVIRGFSTPQASNSNVALPSVFPTKNTMLPELTASSAPKMVKPLQSAMAKKDAQFTLGGSSEKEGMNKSLLSAQAAGLTKQHKQTSSTPIDSDSDDYIDESAIDDDDDSSDWEDSIEDSGKSSVDDKYFQRVDSNINLTPRRSPITLMVAQLDTRMRTIGDDSSQPPSAIPEAQNVCQDPSLGSPDDSDDAIVVTMTLEPIDEISQSSVQPIAALSPMNIQGDFSPRTTRRHMLSTELTESLRRHLLWERQQKSATANAVLKRRYSSHDAVTLKQLPVEPCIKQSDNSKPTDWYQVVQDTSSEYHCHGW